MRNGRLLWGVLCFVLFTGCSTAGYALTGEEEKDGFVSLFNGTDFSGWKVMGNPKAYGIEDGSVVCYGKKGDHLRSANKYENFILRFEYKISKGGNNGVYIHCPDYGRQSRVGGEIQVFDSYGKKPDNVACASLYDVFAPSVNACKPPQEWQSMEVSFIWPRLKVIHNGQLVQDVDVTTSDRSKYRTRYGYIGIQDHGDKAWYRNIRIKDLGGNDESKWIPLLNKDDLDNWFQLGDTNCSVKDGVLTLNKSEGYLISKNRYENFELWAYYKTNTGSKAKIDYRWKGTEKPGYRVILNNNKNIDKEYTGSIDGIEKANEKHTDNKHWYPLQIIVKGNETVVVVNGRVAARYDKTELGEGNIAIEMPKGMGKGQIQLRDIRVKPM